MNQPAAKRRKGVGISTKWVGVDVNSDEVFDGALIDGFLGLEEMHDYTEADIKLLASKSKTRKRRALRRKQCLDEQSEFDVSASGIEKPGELSQESNSFCEKAPAGRVSDVVVEKKVLSRKKKQKRKNVQKQTAVSQDGKPDKDSMKGKGGVIAKNVPDGTQSNDDSAAHAAYNTTSVEGATPCEIDELYSDMSEWNGLDVPHLVLKALAEKGFTVPTPIQKATLPSAIAHRRDIIGAAETGSGKTLAFGIPLIKLILDLKERNSVRQDEDDRSSKRATPLYALVVAPTRELALQVQKHIADAAKYTRIMCVPIVGGMALVKQERLLSKCPEIVVGTPGRLHKLILDGNEHLAKLSSVSFLVIDEFDRLMETGHFKEMNEILQIVHGSVSKKQVLIFSATLTLPQYHKHRKSKPPANEADNELQSLMNNVGLNAKAKVIDLTTKRVTAELLSQKKVICNSDEKDLYLLFFLLCYPGRTIVFANSITNTKRLCGLFGLLGFEPLQLHADKQQRQRLKCLDRFSQRENSLLIATDVAARGLDIASVQYVVHYQLPHDPKVYIHRSGRTARAQEDGMSLILESAEDFRAYQKIKQVLKLEEDIETLEVDSSFLDPLSDRIQLARKIEKAEFKTRKSKADKNWKNRIMKGMDIDIDDDEKDFAPAVNKKEEAALSHMKKELARLMKMAIYPSGFSGSYPTMHGFLKVPGLSKH